MEQKFSLVNKRERERERERECINSCRYRQDQTGGIKDDDLFLLSREWHRFSRLADEKTKALERHVH